MAARLSANARFVRLLVAMNLRAALEYRASFIAGAVFMAISDGMWIVFWSLFFHRFPAVRGWGLDDVVTMWAIAAFSFGLATGIFGNCRAEGARLIAHGQLDYYLSLPKNPLLHFLLGSISVAAWGDTVFGIGAYTAIVQPDPVRFALFLFFGLTGCALFVAFGLLVNALAFWTGHSEGLALQVMNALITFSTYPLDLFSVWVKVLLFAALPAAFVTYLPAHVLREFDWRALLAVAGFAAAWLSVAIWVFFRGLRRYESGSLVAMRG